jgi:hypothetical protein
MSNASRGTATSRPALGVKPRPQRLQENSETLDMRSTKGVTTLLVCHVDSYFRCRAVSRHFRRRNDSYRPIRVSEYAIHHVTHLQECM